VNSSARVIMVMLFPFAVSCFNQRASRAM
jgi:hypothetical protein